MSKSGLFAAVRQFFVAHVATAQVTTRGARDSSSGYVVAALVDTLLLGADSAVFGRACATRLTAFEARCAPALRRGRRTANRSAPVRSTALCATSGAR